MSFVDCLTIWPEAYAIFAEDEYNACTTHRFMLKCSSLIEPWETEKLAKVYTENWDLYLTQALAAIRLSIHEASILSPYYKNVGHDVVWPVDNLLNPRRKYTVEDRHKLIKE